MTKQTNGVETKVAVAELGTDVKYLKEKIDNIDRKLDAQYVTQDEFDPIRKLVYGIVGLILTAVVGALISVVVNRGG
jgi:hypothetical protein